MIYSLISMTVDSIYLFYFFIKNSIYGTYYLYSYLTGYSNDDITEVSNKELEDIKKKMEHQEQVLIELTNLLKNKNIQLEKKENN